MAASYDVAVPVGSLRRNSYSGRLAQALLKLAPERLAPHIVPIGELALYNLDLDAAPPLQQPEAYIGHSDKLFDETGKVADDRTRVFLTNFMEAFAVWIDRCLQNPER